jgi:hypothetical protein
MRKARPKFEGQLSGIAFDIFPPSQIPDFISIFAINIAVTGPTAVFKQAIPPFPSLVSSEMLRFDRSKSCRQSALCSALTESAHQLSAAALESFHSVTAFWGEFSGFEAELQTGQGSCLSFRDR